MAHLTALDLVEKKVKKGRRSQVLTIDMMAAHVSEVVQWQDLTPYFLISYKELTGMV